MVLSRVRYRRHFRAGKEWAVGTTLLLIFTAFVLARWLSKTFPDGSGLELIYAALMLFFSWDMVNALVTGAIDAAKDKEIQEYEKTQTSQGILERQNLEYYALVEYHLPLPSNSRRHNIVLSKSLPDPSLEAVLLNSFAHDTILRGLENNDELLVDVALRACLEALSKENASNEEIKRNESLKLFRQDIYVYLRVWMMFSIKNRREMPVRGIKHRYPNESSPDKYAYIRAIKYIRDHLIDRPNVSNLLKEEYRERSKEILKDYLTKLITGLENYPS